MSPKLSSLAIEEVDSFSHDVMLDSEPALYLIEKRHLSNASNRFQNNSSEEAVIQIGGRFTVSF